jgi:hypothetical protein
MPLSRGRRVLLASAAAALVAGTAGVALGDGDDPAAPASAADFPALRAGHWKWSFSGGSNVIDVRSRRCPKDHPHKVGTFSYSTTRIVDGKVTHRSAKGSLCAN